MGIFGNEFWNVMMSPSPGQLTYDPIRSTDPPLEVRRKLQAILYLAAGDDPVLWTGGGIVYLPPGSYQIGWDSTSHSATATYWESINNPDLFVPPNVMLWFAPGATLVLQQEVVVSISGSVRAEPQQIFRSPLVSAPARRGRVVFQTTRVHEVYPEWWGAIHFADRGEASAPGNTLAFADCLRAAHTDRTFPTRSYPALPIVLGGSYAITSELVIEPMVVRTDGMGTAIAADLRERTGRANFEGIVLLGRRPTGGAGTPATLFAAGTFTRAEEDAVTGRALLCINGLHGSLIEGVAFNAANVASACVQITGENARSSAFRDCAFNFARHVLVQVGDYVIEAPETPETPLREVMGRRLPQLAREVGGRPLKANLDLTGLTFENCTFTSVTPPDLIVGDRANEEARAVILGDPNAMPPSPGTAHRVVGLIFQANQTLPMILDHCQFSGPMLACIEAYGGLMIIRGCTSQNQLWAPAYKIPNPPRFTRDRPRGGVDIFIGDPLPQSRVESGELRWSADPPTGLTVVQFESQSDHFLDTFRHVSSASGRVLFFPSVLQGVSARSTSPVSPPTSPASPRIGAIVFWSGPSITMTPGSSEGAGASLTLIGCTFGGPRGSAEMRVSPNEPTGAIVVDKDAMLVADIGTHFSPVLAMVDRTLFWQFDRMLLTSDPYRGPMRDPREFTWYRQM